jgi:hypothetical protein
MLISGEALMIDAVGEIMSMILLKQRYDFFGDFFWVFTVSGPCGEATCATFGVAREDNVIVAFILIQKCHL